MTTMNRHAILICHGTLAEGFKTNIETILVALKNEMLANKSKKQPAEGQTY